MNKTIDLIIDICDDKKDLLIDQYEAFCETIDKCEYSDEKYEEVFDNLTFDFDSILYYTAEHKHVYLNSSDFIFSKSDLDVYIDSLSNYDKYNKLHILKNKTKLNNDVIFNLIIKYL